MHARSRADKFSGQADWDVISRVKEAVCIPVIGNGDVRDPVAARDMVSTTGCDMVMVGRWAIGNPWIFGQIEQYLDDGRMLPDPTVSERMNMAIRHLYKSIEAKGPKKGIYELRRNLAAYIKGLPGAKDIRPQLMTEEDPDTLAEMLSALSLSEDQKKVVV
jgi:tRNA-dihydrouridine synthase